MSDANPTPISFEFFPPKTTEGATKLEQVRRELYALQPEFFSVTYGAGGSTQDGTLQQVQAILAEGHDAAPHFSCIGATRESVRAQLQQFKAAGIRRMVALRGDLPSGHGTFGEFRYASELVAFIRAETGDHFHIEVGCYPEVHPQAKSPESDVQAYVTKVKAGPVRLSPSIFTTAMRISALSMKPISMVQIYRWWPASCPSSAPHS